MNKPSVFISYNHRSAPLVERVVEKIDPIANVFWDQRLGHWESFKGFMDTISNQDYVVVIISDAYLKSINCQYEVLQLMRNKDWDKKTMFIVEDSEFYCLNNRIKYIDYWGAQVRDFQEELTRHDSAAVLQLATEMEKCEQIRNNIGDFMSVAADTNNPDVDCAISAIASRMKISAKKNTHNELEEEIIKMVTIGINTTVGIAVATNRSVITIRKYISKLVVNGKLICIGAGKHRQYTIPEQS